jgi:hypothetical protein
LNHITFFQWDAQWVEATAAITCAIATRNRTNRTHIACRRLLRCWRARCTLALNIKRDWLAIDSQPPWVRNRALLASTNIPGTTATPRLIALALRILPLATLAILARLTRIVACLRLGRSRRLVLLALLFNRIGQILQCLGGFIIATFQATGTITQLLRQIRVRLLDLRRSTAQ